MFGLKVIGNYLVIYISHGFIDAEVRQLINQKKWSETNIEGETEKRAFNYKAYKVGEIVDCNKSKLIYRIIK